MVAHAHVCVVHYTFACLQVVSKSTVIIPQSQNGSHHHSESDGHLWVADNVLVTPALFNRRALKSLSSKDGGKYIGEPNTTAALAQHTTAALTQHTTAALASTLLQC